MEIALMLCGIAVTVLAATGAAQRLDVPAPFLLIAVGVAGSSLPGVPQVQLGQEVVLLGLLPPLLYAAAQRTSLVDFNQNRRPILLLSVGLVVFTAVGVAVVARWVLPDLPWAVALALGAVVGPPDAVAATAIGRRIGLPRRVVTILEGESLLNDATALVLLRTALAVAAGTGLDAWDVTLDFMVAAGGGVLVGVVGFAVVARVRRVVSDPVLDSALSLVVPFATYLAAEEVHASGVLAVVVAGLLLGHQAPRLQGAQARIADRLNWRTIAFVLENTVFLLIGLQASWIVEGALDSDLSVGRMAGFCLGTLAAVVVLRLVWMFPTRYLLVRPGPDPDTGQEPPWTQTFLLGWAGMRGVVTLAAAFLVPPGTPYRELLVLAAFTVVAGTLFGQGLSLPWVARRLAVPSPDPAEDALARATVLQQAAKAGIEELERQEYDDPHGVAALVRERLDQRTFAAWERLGTTAGQETPSELYARLRLAMLEAERRRVLEIRGSGSTPADVVAEVLAMLDVEESMLEVAGEERAELRSSLIEVRRSGEGCADLAAHPAVETAADPVCAGCVEEGTPWVALRQCLTCGTVGCCDSSPRQHATRHFRDTTHPVMQSAEPGESWRWCYVHHTVA